MSYLLSSILNTFCFLHQILKMTKNMCIYTFKQKCTTLRHIEHAALKRFISNLKSLKHFLKKSLKQRLKMQKQMCSFLFSSACKHKIFGVAHIQLYPVGNWQFRYYYDFWKSLNVFWKILCDKASKTKNLLCTFFNA